VRQSKTRAICKVFRLCESGFLQVDVKYLSSRAAEKGHRYLFVAIGHATVRVFVQARQNKTALSVNAFLAVLREVCPIRVTRLWTDNGVH